MDEGNRLLRLLLPFSEINIRCNFGLFQLERKPLFLLLTTVYVFFKNKNKHIVYLLAYLDKKINFSDVFVASCTSKRTLVFWGWGRGLGYRGKGGYTERKGTRRDVNKGGVERV